MSGYIYCLYNEVHKFYGDDIYKLGMAIDVNKRLNGYITSYIKPSIIERQMEVSNMLKAEKLLFYKLKDYRIEKNREFFKVGLKKINQIFDFIKDVDENGKLNEEYNKISYTKDDLINEMIEINNNELMDDYKNTTAYNKLQELRSYVQEIDDNLIENYVKNEVKCKNLFMLCGKKEIDELTKDKINYVNNIVKLYGFKDPFDFDTIIDYNEEIEIKLKNTKWLYKENYIRIKKLFNKEYSDIKSGFTKDKFTLLVNTILNDFSLKLISFPKTIWIKSNKKTTKEYKYALGCDKYNLKKYIDKY